MLFQPNEYTFYFKTMNKNTQRNKQLGTIHEPQSSLSPSHKEGKPLEDNDAFNKRGRLASTYWKKEKKKSMLAKAENPYTLHDEMGALTG